MDGDETLGVGPACPLGGGPIGGVDFGGAPSVGPDIGGCVD